MPNHSKIWSFGLLFFSINFSNHVSGQTYVDTIFVKWNKATFKSLSTQEYLAVNAKTKNLYENRIEALKAYLRTDGLESINDSSIRYKFLKNLFSAHKSKRSILFVVEANESGYMMTLRNFVVYVDSHQNSKIVFYIFENGRWKIEDKSEISGMDFKSPLAYYLTSFGKGFNTDDVIITRFNRSKVEDSEYYLYSTLSNKGSFKKIIE